VFLKDFVWSSIQSQHIESPQPRRLYVYLTGLLRLLALELRDQSFVDSALFEVIRLMQGLIKELPLAREQITGESSLFVCRTEIWVCNTGFIRELPLARE
jgi:hypothetical protein